MNLLAALRERFVKAKSVLSPDVWCWLRNAQEIQTVIDIGANNGEFARFLSRFFHARTTYAFEALPSVLPALRARADEIPDLRIFDVALSDTNGEAPFFENSYGPASSLLRVTDVSKSMFPQTSQETALVVPLRRLDDLVDADSLEKDIFIKIDVQGVEDRVIRGGERVFRAARWVLIEVSYVPFYEGQPLFGEVHALLSSLGYRFRGLKNQIDSPQTGQPLFAHCFYER